MTLDRDSLLKDRYRISEILGQGGMGSVYRAVDENLGVEVAVKENLFTTDEYTRQFTREATILASLRHPNLPRVSDHFEIREQGQYLVMDYIEGEDLRQRMDRVGILPDEEVIIMGAGICDALEYLHTREPSILHRDIKPGNIKIAPNGNVYLVDFGLAKIVKGTQATTTGARAMTPGYSSPEQYGTARTDARSDVYSLGATMYAALTGAIPEDGLARAMEQADLTPVRKRNPRVGRRLAQVIEKALAIHPEDRYQSAEDFKFGLLGASTATRRQIEAGEATLPPGPAAPFVDEEATVEEGEPAAEAAEEPAAERRRDVQPVKPPAQKIVEPVMSGESTMRMKRKRRQKVQQISGVMVLVVAVLALVYYGINGSFSGLWPFGSDEATPTATEFVVERPTDTEVAVAEDPTETEEPEEPTATDEPTATEEPVENGTETPEMTATATEEATFTPTATLRSPEGNRVIAFASDRSGMIQIWLYYFETGELVQLTDKLRGACQPDFSPDGTYMIYISPCSTRAEQYLDARLYIIPVDDPGDERRLETVPGTYAPSWSPVNENEILYVRYVDAISTAIYRYDLDTDEAVQMTEPGNYLNYSPVWAPDGETFAFISTRQGGARIYVMENEPLAEGQLLTRSGLLTNSYPSFSPDGRYLLFSGRIPDDETSTFQIYQVELGMLDIEDLADYFEERISLVNVPEVDPEYSQDGAWIVMESWPGGFNHDIYIVDAEGGEKQPIDEDPALDFDPTWMPIAP